MIATFPVANVAQLLATCAEVATVYIKQYGPGNLRLSGLKEELTQTINLAVQDGIAQATGDGWKQYFWKGDLWAIVDAPGSLVIEIPSNQYYINRGVSKNSPATLLMPGSDLSTYQ